MKFSRGNSDNFLVSSPKPFIPVDWAVTRFDLVKEALHKPNRYINMWEKYIFLFVWISITIFFTAFVYNLYNIYYTNVHTNKSHSKIAEKLYTRKCLYSSYFQKLHDMSIILVIVYWIAVSWWNFKPKPWLLYIYQVSKPVCILHV